MYNFFEFADISTALIGLKSYYGLAIALRKSILQFWLCALGAVAALCVTLIIVL